MPRLRSRLAELSALANDQDWSDHKSCSSVLKEKSCLEDVLGRLGKVESDLDFLSELESIGGDPGMDSALSRASTELDRLGRPEDKLDAFMVIQHGVGGTEACAWSEMLLRMYAKYARRKDFKADLIDVQYNKPEGIRAATLRISGDGAFGIMRDESGVHRLSRVSPFDQADRRQTSFAKVEVFPDLPRASVPALDMAEVEVTFTCGGGPGGQKVNKTEMVAVCKHLPTGVMVRCQETRSRDKNREIGLEILSAKLEQTRRQAAEDEARRRRGEAPSIAFGSEDKVRSYILTQGPMVHDHRTGRKTVEVDRVLEGELDLVRA